VSIGPNMSQKGNKMGLNESALVPAKKGRSSLLAHWRQARTAFILFSILADSNGHPIFSRNPLGGVGTVAHDPVRTTHMRIEEKREERGEFGLTHDEENGGEVSGGAWWQWGRRRHTQHSR
jgi:hypothetical protein